MGNKIFQRYFLLASGIIFLFIFLGFSLSRYISQAFHEEPREMLPPIFMAQIIDHLNFANREESLKALASWHKDDFEPQMILLQNDGQVLYPPNLTKTRIQLNEMSKLSKAYDYVDLSRSIHKLPQEIIKNSNMGPGLPPDGGFGGPIPPPPPDERYGSNANREQPRNLPPPSMMPPPPMPPGPMQMKWQWTLIKLDDADQKLFLIIGPPLDSKKENKQQLNSFGKWMPFFGIGSLILSLMIGVGVTILIIYLTLRKMINEADSVMSEIKKGNLQARFKVTRQDEFGEAMQRFNLMAGEIESLVQKIKDVEKSRTKLLQELAHDLRTPIASLKNLNEILENNFERLDEKTRSEMLQLSAKEIDYFSRLVEDLLVLSQVHDPRYDQEQNKLDLKGLVIQEVDRLESDLVSQKNAIEIKTELPDESFEILGDRYMLQRMIRNALENARNYSKKAIHIRLSQSQEPKKIVLEISDDGKGFSTETLMNFGERRVSRQLQMHNGKLSLGLGSVIMKRICEAHGGQLKAINLIDENGLVSGAQLRFEFNS